MSSPPRSNDGGSANTDGDPNPLTYASFSPVNLDHSPSAHRQRSTILVNQKSPLLAATPPQVTRALAYSHPFILPLNAIAGLLSWSTGDPWESFLLLSAFWFTTLYGDILMRWAGPLLIVTALMLAMYSRRYSPLSSARLTGEKGQKSHKGAGSEDSIRHRKSLDEIVETLKEFTLRCNLLLDPFFQLTDFLSTQRTATSATTRPALTALFMRILLLTPIWIILALPPLHIITTRRVFLTVGTLGLSWHSRPARVSRTILWRSRTVRRITSSITGMNFDDGTNENRAPPLPPRTGKVAELATGLDGAGKPAFPGIKFTFPLYENQRRWLGLGWTSSMLAYERAPWTDEFLNPAAPKERFELPEVEGARAKWRWVEGSQWRIEGGERVSGINTGKADMMDGGWVYYDSKWQNPRLEDSWGRYTRRRKWCRDAELVEVTPEAEITPSPTPKAEAQAAPSTPDRRRSETAKGTPPPDYASVGAGSYREDDGSGNNTQSQKGIPWFVRQRSPAGSQRSSGWTEASSESNTRVDESEDVHTPHLFVKERDSDWALGDDARMELG